MKNIYLYGANCTKAVWDDLQLILDNPENLIIEYPHEITEKAETISDIAQWAYDTYGKDLNCNCLIGHSMGGLIALELVTKFGVRCEKVILIESNLKPAEKFYRNLMTPENMAIHGAKIIPMIKGEAPFYSDELKQSLQTDFDFTDLIHNSTIEIHGIFGDRGEANYKDRISDLNLGKDIENNINFHFIQNSCHMPMVENPKALAAILRELC
ncbi:alpha/beta hydrolase [Chloroflexota bacterium]|nr:alpha/beta hydrolase [Chloroflexota bacterium]